jgi:hypothetical protein
MPSDLRFQPLAFGDVGELQPPGRPPLADQMAVWLIARLLVAVQKQAEKSGDGEIDLKTSRELLRDVVAVRRGDHSGVRLKMEQERKRRLREILGLPPEPLETAAMDGAGSKPAQLILLLRDGAKCISILINTIKYIPTKGCLTN